MTEYTYEYKLPLTFPASPEDIFRAVTTRDALLAWFCEDCDIDPKPGGPFVFWGKYTVDTPFRAKAKQELIEIEAPNKLSFSWPLWDRSSVVTWSITKAEKEGSEFTVKHVFDSLPDMPRAKEYIDDMWRLYTGNLFSFVSDRSKIFRPNLDDPDPIVRQDIIIDAAPEKVFAALTEPELIKQWFPAPAPFIDPKVGGQFGFGYQFEVDGKKVDAPAMTILEYEQDKVISYTWPDWRGDPDVPAQTVKWELEKIETDKTRLTLTHSGFTRAVDVSDYPFGWVHFAREIKRVVLENSP